MIKRNNTLGQKLSERFRLKKTDINKRIKELQWRLVGEYINNRTNTEFKCINCGEISISTYARITTKRKICQCHRNQKKFEHWQEEAKKRGGRLVTNKFIGDIGKLYGDKLYRNTIYKWECRNGHQWTSSIGSVIGAKSWCLECQGIKKRTLKELKDVVKSRGGKLLSKEFKGSDAKYDFVCNLGHKFSNGYRHIVDRNQWCPTCSKGTKSEEMTRTAFEFIFNTEFPKCRPKWLRNSRNFQMELDGYSEKLGIAFEYQGIQHYKTQSIFSNDIKNQKNKEQILLQRIKDDRKKEELCKKNNVYLFLINYQDLPENYSQRIKEQCLNFGIDINKYNFKSKINFDKAFIRDDRLNELKALLSKKNIVVKSKKWISVQTKYEFLCSNCGYEWSAQGNAFFNTRRVAGCKKCAMRKLAEKNRQSLDVLIEYAKQHNGKVLSKEYIKSKYKYKFQCEKGHIFERDFNNMKYRNQFCPECEKNKK